MRSRIMRGNRSVPALANEGVVADNDRAYRHLALGCRTIGQYERMLHPALVETCILRR